MTSSTCFPDKIARRMERIEKAIKEIAEINSGLGRIGYYHDRIDKIIQKTQGKLQYHIQSAQPAIEELKDIMEDDADCLSGVIEEAEKQKEDGN